MRHGTYRGVADRRGGRGGGRFAERLILDARLGGHELAAGDVDGDGRIDILSKPWGTRPWNALGGKMHVDFLRNAGPLPPRKDKQAP